MGFAAQVIVLVLLAILAFKQILEKLVKNVILCNSVYQIISAHILWENAAADLQADSANTDLKELTLQSYHAGIVISCANLIFLYLIAGSKLEKLACMGAHFIVYVTLFVTKQFHILITLGLILFFLGLALAVHLEEVVQRTKSAGNASKE